MKVIKFLLKLIFFSMFLFSNAQAGAVDGNQLSEAHQLKSNVFDWYVYGVADLSQNIIWCPPSNVKAGQLPKIVENYLEAHPEELHKGAASLVINALKVSFPCKK